MKKIGILDLRIKAKLSVEDAMLIDKIEPVVRTEFNNLIKKIIYDNSLSSLSLLLSVTCRNTMTSPVLDTLCRARLLEEKIKNGDILSTIYVENYETAELIKSVLAKYSQLEGVILEVEQNNNIIKIVLVNIIKSLYFVMNDWLWTRLMRLKYRPSEPIIYVDNFLFVDSFKDGSSFYDRYYTGHEKFLSRSEKQKEWYAPTLVGMRYPSDYIRLGKGLQRSKTNFLLQEAWLTVSDYIFSFLTSLILPFKVSKYPSFSGYSIKNLIISELRKEIAKPSLMRAIDRYRFIRRLKKQKVEICGVIDWNEICPCESINQLEWDLKNSTPVYQCKVIKDSLL